MNPGIYVVQSWNGKDGILLRADDEFLAVTKSDLPKIFEGVLFVGEKVEVKHVTTIEPIDKKSMDDRARESRKVEAQEQVMSQKHRDFIYAENERRAKYGVKPLS